MKTGVSSQIFSVMPRLRVGLERSIMGTQYGQPNARCEPRVFNGKHEARPAREAGGDALILEIRRLHEQHGMKPPDIHRHISAIGYRKTKSWVAQCCGYHNRSFLTPAANADSYLKAAT